MSEAATQAQPKVLSGVAAYLTLDGALKAADFYVKAFGARIAASQPADDKGRTLHVHLYLNGASLMLCDAFPEHGHGYQTPQGFMLHLQVEDADLWWNRAVNAGLEVAMPLQEMFWGDRYGQLRDPYGVMWTIGQSKA